MNTTFNIDPNEIARFEALATRWWDPESEFRTLHQINPLRLEFINQRAPLENKKVLDVGCGGGILAESMAREGARVTGIDMGEKPLSVARLHLKESGLDIDYQLTTAEALAEEESESFDIITCMEMVEHVPDPASVINACSQLVKPGGDLFFSTLNRTPKAWLFAIVGAEYLLNLLPRGTHTYEKFVRPSELESWARASGLNMREITGMHYNPITDHYWLAPGVEVNYLVHATHQGELG